MRRIGHKGADALAPGNTLASFEAAAEAGVSMIEFDVLRPRTDFDAAGNWRAAPAGPAEGSGPLVIAHDWADAARRADTVLTLDQALDALASPSLSHLEFDLDLKTIGREDEIADAVRERGLLRAGDDLGDGDADRAGAGRDRARAAPRLDPAEGDPRLDPHPVGEAVRRRRNARASQPLAERDRARARRTSA